MTRVFASPNYPQAPPGDMVEVLHGREVSDPYRWLEDANNPHTVRWLAEQQELFAAEHARWVHRDAMAELVDLARSGDIYSAPRTYQGRQFFGELSEGKEHPVLICSVNGNRMVLVNVAELDPSGRTVLQAWEPSWEGELVAIQLCEGGSEDATLQVIDGRTGALVDGPIDRVRNSSIGWLPGGRQFYYVRRLPPELHPGEERYHRRIYLHTVGRPVAEDVLIFGAGRDKLDYYSITVEPTTPRLVITAAQGTAERRDVWIADVSTAPDEPVLVPIQVGIEARTYVHFAPGQQASELLYLRTYDGASRGRIVIASASCPDGHRRELIAEDPDATITDMVILNGRGLPQPLILLTRARHAISEIAIFGLRDGNCLGLVPLPGPGGVSRLHVDQAEADKVWFTYTDSAIHAEVLCYDAATGYLTPWAISETPAKFGSIMTRQVQFQSADGTTVRMFILSGSGAAESPRPTILTGYGGFGAVVAPGYRADARAWVQAGGVYALACLRGGGEEGAAWHRAGIRDNKPKVFEDFDAATDYLLREGWTTEEQLGIYGRSNGGLLVGAALTRHPEKYAAVVCTAPLLDMVRYETSGMGPSWRSEYGTAAEPAEFAVLLGYSPYHAVRPGTAYPAVLLSVFDADTRVDPLHARKMCARMQAATTGRRPILLRTEPGVGHGMRAVSSSTGLMVDCLAFFADQLGLPAAVSVQ